jgi:hypothetical protein
MAELTQKNLNKFIISVVLIGVILILGIYITDSMQTLMFKSGETGSVTNETLTSVTEAGETLEKSTLRDVICSVSSCVNSSNGAVIPVADYDTATNCVVAYVINSTEPIYNNSNWKCTYTYSFTNDTASSTSAHNVTIALSTGTSWISILVVVGFATIILSLLTGGLGSVAKNEGEVPYY